VTVEKNKSKKQHLSDEELLAEYQRADVDAFTEFFERHRALIFSYLRSILSSQYEAEEAFQRTFLKLHRYILKYDPTQSALGWVMTIARNVAVDVKIGRSYSLPLEDAPVGQLSLDERGRLDARKALETLIKRLSPTDQKLLEQRYLKEESYDEIAEKEGWTVENTRQKFSRLLRKLRSLESN
jgi:RNA polymerase sigma factor (sigma-70 family)